MTEDADAVVERVGKAIRNCVTRPPYTQVAEHMANEALSALKPGDRLPGGLVVVPEKPTWAMEQASLTAPMPPFSDDAPKKKRHERLVAKIHSRWNAMLDAASGDAGCRLHGGNEVVDGDAFSVGVWTDEERDGMAAAYRKAEERGRGHYETLVAVGAWLLRHRAAKFAASGVEKLLDK